MDISGDYVFDAPHKDGMGSIARPDGISICG